MTHSPSSPEDFAHFLAHFSKNERVSPKLKTIFHHFYESYKKAIEVQGLSFNDYAHLLKTFLLLVQEQLDHPYQFEPYHERVRSPFDYYKFGIDLFRPLVNYAKSSTLGLDELKKIEEYLQAGHNVILLSNHQTEADPQAISLLLEKTHSDFAENMIFVAGERVITDPLAIPGSLGRNLLCIYSKRYIDNPIEQKLTKQLHNKRTMELMSALLTEGGKCIYVAPSGGRDRRNAEGVIEVAPYDPQSIEMFYLMSKKAKTPTHFFTLALKTYDLLPPPETIQTELGELRLTQWAELHLCFGKEIDMENFPGSDIKDKHLRREKRGAFIHAQVKSDYEKFI